MYAYLYNSLDHKKLSQKIIPWSLKKNYQQFNINFQLVKLLHFICPLLFMIKNIISIAGWESSKAVSRKQQGGYFLSPSFQVLQGGDFGIKKSTSTLPLIQKFPLKRQFSDSRLEYRQRTIAAIRRKVHYVCTVYLNIEYLVPQQTVKEDY